MELDWITYALMLAAGLAAGIVNTLAGSGSVFTLAVLFTVLPANIANGTNRLGVLLQCLVGVLSLRKANTTPIKTQYKFIFPTLLGAMVGAIVATQIATRHFELVVGFVMIGLLILMISNPKKRLKKFSSSTEKGGWMSFIALLLVGFYGGFIQVGIGVLLLISLVVVANMDFVQANLFKLLIVLVYTVPVFGIFIYQGQVNWELGSWVAVGQVIGSYGASKFAIGHPKASVWIQRLIIVMILLSIFKMFFWHLVSPLLG